MPEAGSGGREDADAAGGNALNQGQGSQRQCRDVQREPADPDAKADQPAAAGE